MPYQLRFSQYNKRSILIEWPAFIDENVLNDVLNFKNCITSKYLKQNIEIIYAYNSILIIYESTIENINDNVLTLKSLYLDKTEIQINNFNTWEIPVCYDDKFGVDLESFSKQNKLQKPEVIALHSEAIYTVFFIGFLPGFLYLGGLNSKLYLDRKTTPNLNVKKGSVAIGGQQTGIYPQDSPGGWHVIGNSPIDLFNPALNPPCFIKPGDKVKFKPVSTSEYYTIKQHVEASTFQLKPIEL
jgi:inhibitor of KinA